MEGMGNSLSVVDICWMIVPILPGLVNVYSLLFKMTIEIVDLPIDSLVILIFHSFLYVYQKLSTCSVLLSFTWSPKLLWRVNRYLRHGWAGRCPAALQGAAASVRS